MNEDGQDDSDVFLSRVTGAHRSLQRTAVPASVPTANLQQWCVPSWTKALADFAHTPTESACM